MAIDMYLQLEGIEGESTDAQHKDWIECETASWMATQPQSATPSRPDIHDGQFMSEHVTLRYSKVKWFHTQQKIGVGSSGLIAGDWNLAANRIA